MNILSVHSGDDTGGQAHRIGETFKKHAPDWTYRYATMAAGFNYIDYPRDLPFNVRELKERWLAADVIHAHNDFRSVALIEQVLKKRRRPMVLHHHGTAFRSNPHPKLRELIERGAIGVASTLDLWLMAPEYTEWLPAPYDVDWLASLKQPSGTDSIVIAHAPTDRKIKSTDAFEAAIRRLQKDYPVQMDLIWRVPWTECLERKARADIFFDQTILGYGCNALEAWGMGIPVVAGAADETLDEMERRFGRLPFYHATEETIYDALRELVESPELRQRYGQIGHDYVRRYHDGSVVVEQLKDIYRRAAGVQEKAA